MKTIETVKMMKISPRLKYQIIRAKLKATKEQKKLALDIAEGQVFGSWSIDKHDEKLMGNIFMPLIFMSKEQLESMTKNKVIHIYEYVHKAGPRSINGYPIFSSMRYMSKDEWAIISPLILNYSKRRIKLEESVLERR
jgi:hypothetical protein